VEGTKFCYVYGNVVGKPEYGMQQVLDMQLDVGERVLGAALMSGASWAPPAHAQLLVLTQQRLLVFTLADTTVPAR
jgi:hypothetical protein